MYFIETNTRNIIIPSAGTLSDVDRFSIATAVSCNSRINNMPNIQLLQQTLTLSTCSLYYWASEVSPTLGCSIEISRDNILCVGRSVGRYVCRVQNCIGGTTWPKQVHAESQIWVVKTDL